jgi:hypothetical protein
VFFSGESPVIIQAKYTTAIHGLNEMHAAYCKPDFAGCEVLTAMTKKSILF